MVGMLGRDANGKPSDAFCGRKISARIACFPVTFPPPSLRFRSMTRGEQNRRDTFRQLCFRHGRRGTGAFGDKGFRACDAAAGNASRSRLSARRYLCRARRARQLNPAPAIPLGAELLGKISYLTPNETELEILTGLPDGDERGAVCRGGQAVGTGGGARDCHSRQPRRDDCGRQDEKNCAWISGFSRGYRGRGGQFQRLLWRDAWPRGWRWRNRYVLPMRWGP